MKIVIEVTGCHDCPMCHHVYEQGFSADCCEHPDSPKKGYESALPINLSTPDWCPAKEKNQ